MNYNPRSIALALTTATALTLGLGACGTGQPTTRPQVNTPAEEPSDCDLDDLEEGDADCNDPVAYAAAVRKHGAKKVAAAQRKYAEKKAREKERKAREDVRKRINSANPIPSRPAAPAAAPKTNSTKGSGGGLFGGSRAKSNSNSGGGFKPFGRSKRK